MKIAIVTACQSGIASSILAADLLTIYAKELGHEVFVECQNSIRKDKKLTLEQIDCADCIIIASNIEIDTSRFKNKKVYISTISDCFIDNKNYLKNAILQAKELVKTTQINQKVQNNKAPNLNQNLKIVAITACPTGVAHTFMAASALEAMALELGYKIKVETRGSVGAKNKLTDDDIKNADLVIIAADIEVDLSRFNTKKVYKTSTKAALKNPKAEIATAKENAKIYKHQGNFTTAKQKAKNQKGSVIYKHLMTGVSHMLPLVVAGGLLIALSFVFGIEAFKEKGTLAAALMNIGGSAAFALMIPVLAGFIAFSIADRPGLAPGLIGGMLASSIGAGFLGGIFAGFVAGYSAKFISEKINLPDSMSALKPILLIPLLASLITGLVMIYIIGEPISFVMKALTDFLSSISASNAVFLGILLGAMMCFDLGGPVNKTAYTFGVGLLASSSYLPMAAIMASGMVPALGMGLATFLAKRKFIKNEQEAGKASFVLGLCFITEGAIPFAAKDPMRVIPSCILGGATTGAISMAIGAKLMAPHGGLFVLFIPSAITPVFMYLVAIASGTVITGISYAFLKKTQKDL